MNHLTLLAYSIAVLVLFGKTLVLISLQGLERLRSSRFRHPEDAAHWGGETVEREADMVLRADRVLRNDAETQPFFLAAGLAYVLVGATPQAAPAYFGVYVVARVLHAWWLLRPTQPLRNRAFAVSLIALMALSVHAVVAACMGMLD